MEFPDLQPAYGNKIEILMRRSNCSAPIPPGQTRGQRKMCVINKGGALEKRVIIVFI